MEGEEAGQEVSSEAEGKKSSSTLPKLLMLGAMFAVFAITILLLWGGRYELARIKPGSRMEINRLTASWTSRS